MYVQLYGTVPVPLDYCSENFDDVFCNILFYVRRYVSVLEVAIILRAYVRYSTLRIKHFRFSNVHRTDKLPNDIRMRRKYYQFYRSNITVFPAIQK